jgi:large repetitive protein
MQKLLQICLRTSIVLLLLALFGQAASATTFTTTVPGTSIVIPAAYPQAGGVVIVLEGANGNVYYQFSNPSTMFQGYQNSGTPAAWMGNPFQIAPTTTIQCGVQSCASYFGGSIARMSIRFTAFDGDAKAGQFDANDLTLRINGTDVGNFTNVATQTTNTAGTTLVASGTGFGDNGFDTGWYQTTNTALLSTVLATGKLTSSVYDRDPNDNYWDFRQGTNLSQAALEIVAPGVTLDKTANKTDFATVGETIRYTYALRNIGTVAINSLAVTDDKIPSANISCTPAGGTIAISSTVTCTADYVVTQADIDAGKVTNVATSAGVPLFGSLGPLTDTVTVTGPAATPSFTFRKTVSPAALGAAGSTLTYGFSFTNTGNVTLASAAISDASLPGLSCTVPAIAPGRTATATCTGNILTVTQAMIDAGPFANTATGSLKPPGGPALAGTQSTAIATGVAVSGTIALTKTASPSPFGAVGSTITYGFTVKNNTNVTVTGLGVSDPSLAALSCTVPSATPGATVTAACTGNTRTVTQADIDAGQIVNLATAIGSASGTPVSDNASRTTPGPARTPSLSIVKSSGTASFNAVSDSVAYSYLVTNTGNTTLTAAITVTDNKIATPNSVSCPALPPGGLAPGDTITCTATYLAKQADIDAGSVTNSATAKSGATVSPSDSISVPSVKSPAMTITKTATEPALFNVGQTVAYEYVIANTGNTTLANPAVTDDRIATVNCPATNLAPGASKTCTANYVLTLDDVNLGSVSNNAFARSGTTRSPTVTVTVPTSAAPALTLAKSASPTTFATLGETITYTFDVTNSGTAASTKSVTIADPKIGSFTCFTPSPSNPTFSAGETISCQRTYLIKQADLDAGTLTNTASASTTFGGNTQPTISPAAEATITADTATQPGELTTTKTVTPATGATVGDVLTYTLRTRNTGAVTVSSIIITDPKFPALSCTIGTLAPNATSAATACRVTYTVTQDDIDAGSVSNTASASGINPKGDPVTDDSGPATSTFAQTSSVTIAKAVASNADADASSSVSLNDVLTYRVTVTNTGSVSQTNVEVNDALLAPPSRTCAILAPAAKCILTGTYVVTQADVDAGKIDNQASVTTALLPTAETDSLSTPVPRTPRIALEKTLGSIDRGADNIANAGDTINYRFAVRNTGNVTLTGITVQDLVPSATVSGGPLASLAPGATDTTEFTAAYVITQADIDAGRISNTAKVTGDTPSGGTASDTSDDPANPAGANDPTIVTLPQRSSLAIAKALTTAPAPVELGSVLTYTVTASNTGTISQRSVVVSDPKLTPAARTCATLLPGNDCVLTGTYTVTQADVDAGRINNTASVKSAALPTPESAALTTDVAQTTGLAIAKSSTTTAYDTVGDLVTYRYRVTNTGTVTVRTTVTVTDDKIVAPREVVCPSPAAGIPPGGFITCTATYEVTQDDLDAGSVLNTAIAKTTLGPGQTIASAPDSATVNATQNPALSVSKSSLTASFDAVGDVITYRYLVRNTGNVTLTSAVTIDDDKIIAPNSVNCPSLPTGGLKPTKTLTCSATFTVTQADLDGVGVTNTATASSGGTTSAPDSVTVPAIKKPALAMTKRTVGAVNFLLGQTVNYQYIVKNTGNVTLPVPVVTDNRIPSVTCPVGDIAPAASITCTASYVLTADDIDIGSVTNNATAKSGTTTSPPDSVTIPQGADPALTLQKSASPTTFSELNETVTYTFKVTNSGNVQFTRPIRISDPAIGNFTCLTPTAGNVFDINETATCTRTYRIKQADLDRGFLRNDASAETTYGGASLPIASPTDSVTIRASGTSQVPELAVTKTVTPATGASLGDVLTFRMSVKNTGKVTVSNVTIDDPKLPSVTCNLGTLSPGETSPAASCTGTYTMTQSDVDRGGFTNTAIANGVAPGGNGVTGRDSVTGAAAVAAPKLKITKSSPSTAYQAVGEPITYKFKVANTGNVTINDIAVTDALVPSFTCAIASLQPGESDDFSCETTYKIKQADIDRGKLANTASVTGKPVRKGDPADADPLAEDTLEIAGPARQGAITLVKSGAVITKTGNSLVAGDEIAYVFSVTNTGNVTLTDITVDDAKVSVSGGPIASLAPGETNNTALTARYTVTQADIDKGAVTNTATARGTSPTGNVSDVSDTGGGDGDDPTIVILDKFPSLAVTKTMQKNDDIDGSGSVSLGDVLNYVIRARNTGNTSLNNVQILDNRITPNTIRCATLASGATCELKGTYKVSEKDVGLKEILNTAVVTSDEFLAGVAGLAATPVKALVSQQQFSKTALKANIRRGERVPYVIAMSKVPLTTARVIDLMPPGFNYVKGSARINGAAASPVQDGRRLIFNNLAPPTNKKLRIELLLVATSGAATGTSINIAQLINPATGAVLGTARAAVTVAPEHVFDCSDIIGKVFDDKNRNAYQDEGEPGLPGVRVATVKGLLVTTDQFGRFHVPCGEIPDEDIGSNFIMKVDTRTLPTGYRLTTENPRTIRVTRGKVSKLNFGAAIGRVVRLDLNSKVFAAGKAELLPEFAQEIDTLLAVLDDETSILRIQYHVGADKEAVGRARMTTVVGLIEQRWATRNKKYRLPIETRIVRTQGAPAK